MKSKLIKPTIGTQKKKKKFAINWKNLIKTKITFEWLIEKHILDTKFLMSENKKERNKHTDTHFEIRKFEIKKKLID